MLAVVPGRVFREECIKTGGVIGRHEEFRNSIWVRKTCTLIG